MPRLTRLPDSEPMMHKRFVSFDGTERHTGSLLQPDRSSDLQAALREPGSHAIRGGGLSYCQASAGQGITSISTRHFDRLLDFDRERLHLLTEPGLTIGDLLRFAVAHDCHFPVLPGHPAITVGGCAAFNVHGKTQHNVGHFSDHVEALTLLHPDHGELRCSRSENQDLFELTLGGMGLTGYIAHLTIQLQRLPGRSVRRTIHPVTNLVEAVELMDSLRERCDALYAWNDLNRRGSQFGRGFVYEERFDARGLPNKVRYRTLSAERRGRLRVSGSTRLATNVLNAAYRTRERLRPETLRSVEDASFPINGNEAYFTMFGCRGFREYQVLFPRAVWPEVVRNLERVIDASGVPVTLGSLKLFAGSPRLLWFRADGICVTIDAAADERTWRLFGELDRLAVDFGALVNLSKDSRLPAQTLQALFPAHGEFGERLEAFDPKRRFDSALRERIDV